MSHHLLSRGSFAVSVKTPCCEVGCMPNNCNLFFILQCLQTVDAKRGCPSGRRYSAQMDCGGLDEQEHILITSTITHYLDVSSLPCGFSTLALICSDIRRPRVHHPMQIHLSIHSPLRDFSRWCCDPSAPSLDYEELACIARA